MDTQVQSEWLVTIGGSGSAKYATVIGRYFSYEIAAWRALAERATLKKSGIRCGVERADEFVAAGGVLP